MKKLLALAVFILFSGIHQQVVAQKGYEFPDSIRYKRNVVKWNLTPFILWSNKNINFAYERVIKPYQSISVNAGYWILPSLAKGRLLDSLDIDQSKKKSGYSVAFDYRFYFKKRNPTMAPNGLYWGPYASYYHYKFVSDANFQGESIEDSNVELTGKLNVMNFGVQLGYQFIIKERLSIDLIFMGPSFALYSTYLNLESNLDIDTEDELIQKIYDALYAKVPGFSELVNEGVTKSSGIKTNVGPGLRYMIQIGYRF